VIKVFEFVERYEVIGGMQDYNYARSNAFDITFELSCCKYPPGSTIPDQWLLNKESLIKYLEQVHIGIKGNVYTHTHTHSFHVKLILERDFTIYLSIDLQVLYAVKMVNQSQEQMLL